jgi:hypothetical protein
MAKYRQFCGMKKHILSAILLINSLISFSNVDFEADSLKTDTIKPADNRTWKLKSIYTLNGSQSSFINWSAGGRNNISLLVGISASANYKKKSFSWSNDLSIALGGLYYIDQGSEEPLQKTDDRIDLSTNIGQKMKNRPFNFTFIGGFKTQTLDGFSFPNDSVRVSTFMAPAYINIAIGLDYLKGEDFSVFTSPLAGKITIVNNDSLANVGAFGVEKAILDPLGNVLVPGKHVRGEFGAYVKMKFNKTIAKNIDLKSKIELFSNYLEDPQNIDVNAEALFNFKVNSWFSASLQWTLIYDDDVQIRDVKGNIGPRTQFKSVIGLGISYKMDNAPKK